ncbi:MFS transporter [Lactobacillus amylovorus]|uniref:MFS transporter n=1 Tax=Lactobacillus amylovorus TaxID=1604 RepID=UPI0021A825B7|nr:MFS transporter [Lactobacillus amylovorus]
MGLIISLAVLTFFTLIATMVFAVKLPTYFVQNHIGSATDASNVWSAVNIATVIGGFMFGPCYKKLGKYILPIALVLGGFATSLTVVVKSLGLVYVIACISGIAGSLTIPYIFNRISEISSAQKAPFFTSIALVGSNLGAFLSPVAGKFLGDQAQTAIFNAGVINIILAVISLGVIFCLNKKSIRKVHA